MMAAPGRIPYSNSCGIKCILAPLLVFLNLAPDQDKAFVSILVNKEISFSLSNSQIVSIIS